LILGVFLSIAAAGLGAGSASLALSGNYPLVYGMFLGLTFATLAIWGIATLGRTSGYPEGRWLVGLSIMTLVTGAAGVVSTQRGP
jgi:hypothetical protein